MNFTTAAQPIRGLHHNAWRCSDSERTRAFYEDLLGLPLGHAHEISSTATGRRVQALHSFFQLGDGSCLAFFEAPGRPFRFKPQHDFDLRLAPEVAHASLQPMKARAEVAGVEVRGVSDHGFTHSIYLHDPAFDPAVARAALARWPSRKPATVVAT